jgi:hypothetical protein
LRFSLDATGFASTIPSGGEKKPMAVEIQPARAAQAVRLSRLRLSVEREAASG